MNPPRLSIIIPCLNEAEYVSNLLEDLANQDIEETFEVIVADSSSDDGTLQVAERFNDVLNLRTTYTKRLSAGHTRNAGTKDANGDFLLFLDADSRIKKHFLRTLMNARDKYDADMMSTHFRSSGWHPFDLIFYWASSRFFMQSFLPGGKPLMTGCCQFVAHELHQQINGYNDEQTVGEDVDYSRRIAEHARRPVFVKRLKVTVSNRRFKTDGRLTMYYRSYEWITGNKLDVNEVHDFEFGHYRKGQRKVSLLHELFTAAGLQRIAAVSAAHLKSIL